MSFESQTRIKLFLNGVKVIDEPTSKVALTAMPAFNIFTADYRIGQGGMEFNACFYMGALFIRGRVCRVVQR